jgi:diguanylate cyclase (GGDEF)-like protein/PAS domain S-box-containing protein
LNIKIETESDELLPSKDEKGLLVNQMIDIKANEKKRYYEAEWISNFNNLAKGLAWRYAIALLLLATLSTAAWFSLHLVIVKQESTAAVINVSGRQRMLSQRTALLANLLVSAPKTERADIRSKLRDAIQLMERSHQGLIQGDTDLGLPTTLSPTVHAMYFDGSNALDGQVKTYLNNVHELLLLDDAALTATNPLLQYITQNASTKLVAALDQMVRQYQLEGEIAVAHLQKEETIFWAFTLLLLVLEASLIFHPFVKHIKAIIEKLKLVTEELHQHQSQLENIIKQRVAELRQSELKNRASEEQLLAFYKLDLVGLTIISPEKGWLRINDYLCNMLEYSEQELRKLTWAELTHPEDLAADVTQFERMLANEIEGYNLEKRFISRTGKIIYSNLVVRCLRKANGKVDYAMAMVEDITERKQNENKLRLAASVFTHAREAIMITEPDGTIIDVNEAFSEITGYSRNEVIGHNPRILSSGHHDDEFYATLWRDLTEHSYWNGEIWNRRKTGEIYAELQSISAVRDAHGNLQHYVSLFSDITLIKVHEQELEHIAHYDALTNLPNRVMLADRLQQAMPQAQRRGQQLVVVFLDLDGFKAINDNHGHKAGDRLLMTVASRMKQVLREGDTLARLGGDEFIAVLTDFADIEASIPTLTRLLAAAAQPVHLGDIMLKVSASLGITVYPQTEDIDADQLLRQADQAMYQAKLAGKNRYHIFDTAIDNSLRLHHEKLDRIRLAISEQEFVLYYQPKVNMRTGDIIGAEALIRWQHPTKGLLLPALFLPMIENHPLSIELGEWVIDTALTQIALWQTQGLNIPVSVNIGARQLQQANFAIRLHEILAAHPDILPSFLELEVLETSALEDIAKVSDLIDACKTIGVNFALDDFGTGYSSLTYLRRLPVTILKIDQSFVRDMLDDPDDLAIIEGVIGLARTFRRQVIAEGVETIEHGTLLLQIGCELAQGYGIARPMVAQQLLSWSSTWKPDSAWVNQSSMSHDDMPILFASIEQRSRISAIEAFIKGESDAPLSQESDQSHFNMWMNTENLAKYCMTPDYKTIYILHREIQTLSAELCELQTRGRNSEALARLGELHTLRDALLEQMKVPVI